MMRSLRRIEPAARFTVLCLTRSCEQGLRRLKEPGVTILPLAELERADPGLAAVKNERTPKEYAFTLASCLVPFVLAQAASDAIVTYLDADLFFYSSPAPLFAAMVCASVGLIGHRHHWWTKRLEKYGRLNVGWVSFRADEAGRGAAAWWRERCLEWCRGHVEGDRFADQKYLDHMIAKLPGVIEITHPGANLGPWNICRHRATATARGLVVDGNRPLIFFHYSGLREARRGNWLCSNVSYLGPFSRTVRDRLYRPYIASLLRIRDEIGGLPQEETPDLYGDLPARRGRIRWLLWLAGQAAGHYVTPRAPQRDAQSVSTPLPGSARFPAHR